MTVITKDDRLVCDECGRGGFADLRGLRGHQRSHQLVTCPECGAEIGAHGIGSHRKAHHDELMRTLDRTAFRRLLPFVPQTVLDRLTKWDVKLDLDSDLWVIVSATFGPHLTNRYKVGQVVSGYHEPAVVFPLSWLKYLREAA